MSIVLRLPSSPSGELFEGANDGDLLIWESATRKWKTGPGSGVGSVTSVFGRTGVVVAVTGDYDSDEVTNLSLVVGTSVSDALDTLLAAIAALSTSRPTPTTSNKGMVASVTVQDNNVACATSVTSTPATSSAAGGGFQVLVNGVSVTVGNASKTGVACYFSADGGATARNQKSIAIGDLLYWNPSVAGFNLAATDLIDFIYMVTT